MLVFTYDDHKFLEDAYYGTGGFRDGSYLISHPRETQDKYNRRRELGYYLNYTAPVVNSHVDPIFRAEPEREWNNNDMFSGFVEDIDTAGATLTKFMKRAALIAKLQGVAFIVVDNSPDQPLTMADALQGRKYPYAYVIKRQQVQSWKTNQAGRLISITYTVTSESSDGVSDSTAVDEWTWTVTSWKVKRASGQVAFGEHGLRCVPVIPLFSRPVDPGNIKPQSEFYAIARTNLRLFNLCSEIDELIRNQAFNVLVYPAGQGQSQDDIKEIVVGTENVMAYDGTLSGTPAFIAPDAGPLQQLQAERATLIQEIYRMAALSHVTGVQDQKSGVAKAWDFETTNQVLADFASNCENAERAIADLFERWTGTTVNFSSTYSDDFGIVDVVGELDVVTKAKDLMIGGTFDEECAKRATAVIFNELPEDRFDAVVKDIEKRSQDAQHAKQTAQPPVDNNGGTE